MKVWGKEVKYCKECNYCSEGNTCSYTGEYQQYSYEEIDKDCPFSKPITSEVIESYGFKFITNKYILPTYEKVCGNMTQCIYLGQDFNGSVTTIFLKKGEEIVILFKGKINNPVELEFILKSLGIVE